MYWNFAENKMFRMPGKITELYILKINDINVFDFQAAKILQILINCRYLNKIYFSLIIGNFFFISCHILYILTLVVDYNSITYFTFDIGHGFTCIFCVFFECQSSSKLWKFFVLSCCFDCDLNFFYIVKFFWLALA